MTRLPRLAVPLAALAGMALITAPAVPAALGSTTTAAVQTEDIPDNLDPSKTEAFSSAVNGLEDVDRRAAAVAPTALQKQKAAALKATVRWNRYGTPGSVLPDDGLLAGRNGSAVSTARSWLQRNTDLFGGAAVIDSLELVNDSKMTRGSTGHAVLFRQKFGELTSAVDGMVTVGVNDRGVVYVSSSLTQASASLTKAAATLSPQQAWLAAAENVGITKTADAIGDLTEDADSGFTTFKVADLAQEQQVRLRAVAVSNSSVRPVYETNVVDVAGGKAVAYTSYVDAQSGEILVRRNQVDNFSSMPMTNSTEPFAGAITSTACGPKHGPYAVDNQTKTITVAVNAALPDTDIIINLRFGAPNGPIVASADLLFSPEVLTYSPPGGVPAGDYFVEVCPFKQGQAMESGEYFGVFSASEQALAAPEKAQPAWKVFLSNPKLDFSAKAGAGPRATMCWVRFNVADDVTCEKKYMLNNLAARLPWDVDPRTFLPTETTSGNAAITAEAWLSPLTPGGAQRPIQPDRTYNDTFTDAWNNLKCSQAAFTPAGNNNDILAAVTNLFAGHNRFHDYSYYLGFTEDNYNLQQNNFGNLGAEGDPEVGNVQAGALTGGQPSFLGRDNANQITLQDGVPGITNQYLFQPIAGAFYAPCVDGDLDATVYGHEYTHAITNRMVAGPDDGLSGFQAGSMGESWSDLVALEYTFSHDYDLGTNPWVLGPYVTGNKQTGIRNYPLNKNPLQYGDVSYDSPGAEVHSDGEVWNAVMWDVRQALVKKFNADFPYTNKRLQIRCAEGFRGTKSPHGPLPPYKCPGNNRWIALMFDSYLLQQSATSMLDARDAYLAADLLRFHGKNHKVIWDAFASDGFGKDASTDGTADDQPIPGYASPLSKEGTVTVRAVDARSGKAVNGQLLVSKYDARVTPVADTSRKTRLGNSVDMVPGSYPMLFRAKGYGITTSQMSVRAGDTTAIRLTLKPNLASKFKGAKIAGTTGAGDPDASRNPDALIDDTQGSNWGVKTAKNVDESHPVINVDLAGGVHMVRTVKVSAFLRPAGGDTSDKDSGSRFTALRQFAIEVCTAKSNGDCTGTGAKGYKRIFTSSPKTFNSVKPRPLAPTLLLKSFNVPDTKATHVRLVVLENQCTGFAGYEGEQDDDLLNDTSCKVVTSRGKIAHAAELQVFD